MFLFRRDLNSKLQTFLATFTPVISRTSVLLFYLGITLLLGCSRSKQSAASSNSERSDSAYFYFEKSKEASAIPEKLRLLKKSASKLESPRDSLFTTILDYQTYYYSAAEKSDSSLYYANRLLQNGLAGKDTATIARGYYRKARADFKLNRQEEVLADTYKAITYYELLNDSLNKGRRLVELGNAQERLGDYSGAQESAIQALGYLKKEDSIYMASAYNIIALCSKNFGDNEGAVREYKNALKYANTTQDSAIIYNNIALIYTALHQYNEASEIFEYAPEKGMDRKKEILFSENRAFLTWLKTGKDISSDLLNYKEERKKLNDSEGLNSSYNHLTRFYEKQNPELALKYAEKYLAVSENLNYTPSRVDALKKLISLAPALEARKYSTEYIAIQDSVEKARNHIKNLFAKIKYDEEGKLKQISRLKKISEVRSLQLARERDQKLIILLILVLLAGLAILIFYYFRKKHQEEKIREVHNTETRLSKKVHDELANDLFQAMTQVPENSDYLLDRLDSIYQRTRDISRENSEINTGENFPQEMLAMITATVPDTTRPIIKNFDKVNWNRLKPEKKIVLYRVLQELMVNLRKHSDARLVVLEFTEEKSALKVSYRDNGSGAELGNRRLSGLQNVENRIRSLNGNINFHSEIDEGFQANMNIPI